MLCRVIAQGGHSKPGKMGLPQGMPLRPCVVSCFQHTNTMVLHTLYTLLGHRVAITLD